MLRTWLSLACLLAASIVVAGCPRDNPVELDPNGSLSFTSTGAIEGTFSVEGALRLTAANQPEFRTWAAADRFLGDTLTVLGFRAGATPRGDMFVLEIEPTSAPRTLQVCAPQTCPGFAAFVIGMDVESEQFIYQRVCIVVTGSINLQSLTNDRARGTFTGEGWCIHQNVFDPVAFTITSGSFDVPRVQGFDGQARHPIPTG